MKSVMFATLGILSASLMCGCGKASLDKPMVADGSVIAVGIKMPAEGKLKALSDKYTAKLWDAKDRQTKEFIEFLKKAGFDKNNFKFNWMLLTSSQPIVRGGDLEVMPDIALSVSFEHDLARVARELEKETKGELVLEESKLGETTIYRVAGDSVKKEAREMREKNVDICMASLEGKLLVVTSNEKAMQAQLDLYLKGKGQSASFKDFALGKGDILRLAAPDIGKKITESVDTEMLACLDEVIPDGAKITANLKTVQLILTSPDGSVLDWQLLVETAKPEDAKAIADLSNGALVPVRAQAKKAAKKSKDAKLAAETLDGLAVTAEGATFKVVLHVPDKVVEEAIEEAAKKDLL